MASNSSTAVITNSRQAILDRIRTRVVAGPDLPNIDPDALIRFEDPVTQFCKAVQLVGATCHRITDPFQAQQVLQELSPFREARRIASLQPEWIPGNTDMRMYDDPHYLKGLDWLIAKGEFGVAENGAIWMDMTRMHHRASLFITQYLAIFVESKDIEHHMHAAYARIGERIRQSFGLFLSGPSKTADIEQSLVLGAHGCRTLNVFVVDPQ